MKRPARKTPADSKPSQLDETVAPVGPITVGGVTIDTSNTETPVRYRCSACGNLTRFDVVTSRRTKAFHHYSVGGELTVEEENVLDERVEEVTCRWCGHGNAVEVVETEPSTE
jgi:DNA-directed RNA polymerase subunit RPC12/RpoP